MFREEAAPWLARLREGVICSRTLRVFGWGESQVESLLRGRMNALTNPTLAPYAKEGEMELRVTAKADSPAAAQALIAPVEQEVRALLGELIYGTGEDTLERVVLEGMKAARDAGQETIVVTSNHKLKAALRLYEKFGFEYVEYSDKWFQLSDVRMERAV